MVLVLGSCKNTKIDGIRFDPLSYLHSMMTESYYSSAQAIKDSIYYNISLNIYPIGKIEKMGNINYVEQALASMQDKLYRQWIYKLEDLEDSKIASHVYKLKNDSLFIGMWKIPKKFDQYGVSLLDIGEVYEVELSKNIDGYTGNTLADNCKSTLRGASFVTSLVSMTRNKITN